MQAKLKCSQCGAELSNVSIGWSKYQYLWMFPFLVLMFWSSWRTFNSHHSYAAELQATVLESRVTRDQFEVIGLLKNVGHHDWHMIRVEAEFFDQKGRFLDEVSTMDFITLPSGGEEHVRLKLSSSEFDMVKLAPKIVLKVSSASEDRY